MKKINLCWLFEHGFINDVPHFKTEFKDEVKSIKEKMYQERMEKSNEIDYNNC